MSKNEENDQSDLQKSRDLDDENHPTNGIHNLQNVNVEENTDHNYASMLPTQPLVTGEMEPLFKALLEQNQALINGLFNNTRHYERSATPSDSSEYLVMPNFLNTLPEFDGRGSSQTAEDWLAAIEGGVKLHRWPDAFRIETARSQMTGPANDWFTGTKIRTWDEFIRQFKHTFIGSKLNA